MRDREPVAGCQAFTTQNRTCADGTLDILSEAIDRREDFFVPDLVFIHRATLGALRRYRDLNNRYQLELLQGAGSNNQTSEQETRWDVPLYRPIQQSAGSAAVLSVSSGATVIYVREALTTLFDPTARLRRRYTSSSRDQVGAGQAERVTETS